MTVTLLAPLWAGNARIQRAANNNPPMRRGETDRAAVTLLQAAMVQAGFNIDGEVPGKFGATTAGTLVAIQKFHSFKPDAGVAGREVLGALDLMLRGWDPPPGVHWGGLLAKANLNLATIKVRTALEVLKEVQKLLKRGPNVAASGIVTLDALKTHFKLVPQGGTKLAREAFITLATINPLIKNYEGILKTLIDPTKIRHSIGTLGLNTAAEAPFGGPIIFGPPFSDFAFDPAVTNIDATGRNSLAAMMMHEATHVIDSQSGNDATTHISEFVPGYVTQRAEFARHNPSAFATFAAHIVDLADRLPPTQRFGLGAGRSL